MKETIKCNQIGNFENKLSTNNLTSESSTHGHREGTGGCQRGWRRGKRGEGIDKYKLAVTK